MVSVLFPSYFIYFIPSLFWHTCTCSSILSTLALPPCCSLLFLCLSSESSPCFLFLSFFCGLYFLIFLAHPSLYFFSRSMSNFCLSSNENFRLIIIITSSYIAHFTIMSQWALHYYPGHWANNYSCNLSQLPGEYQYTAMGYRSAPKTFSNTISTSALAGTCTHLYSWVKRSNHSKVSCSRTQVPQLRPGFGPTLRRLSHQNKSLMH